MHTPGHRPEHTSFLLRDARPRRRCLGRADRRLAVRRRRRAPRPRDRAARGRGRDLPLAARAAARPARRRRGLARPPRRLAAAAAPAIDHKTSSTIGFERAPQPGAALRDRGRVRRRRGRDARRPAAERRAHRRAQPGPADRGAGDAGAAQRRAPSRSAIAEGALLVDARTNEQFDEAHIPGAISASAYDTGFATKVAKVVPPDVELIVVAASDGYELEAAELLASVGLRVRGFLEGGMTAWRSEGRPVQRIELIDPDAARRAARRRRPVVVLDVRDERRVRRGAHPRLGPHPLRRAARAPGRAAARPGDRRDLQRRQAQRPRRLDPAARGLRAACSTSANGGVGTWRRGGRPVESG